MMKHFLVLGFGAMLLIGWSATTGPTGGRQELGPAVATAPDSGVELQGCGPVHEALAEPLLAQPRPPPIVPKQPPALIEELRPDQKPQGNNLQWLGGYWAWDDGSNNFLWVRGIWRDLSPGRQWVPGYWTRQADGWQRVPGYWVEFAKFNSCRPPPASVEIGPAAANNFSLYPDAPAAPMDTELPPLGNPPDLKPQPVPKPVPEKPPEDQYDSRVGQWFPSLLATPAKHGK